MPAASPVVGVPAVDCDAVVLPLLELIVLEVWLLGLVAVPLVCPLLGLVLDAAELGAVEALLEEVCDALALVSDVELGVVADAPVLALVGLLLLADVPALVLMVNCSFTCFTPLIDFAISLARFLSAFDATVPVSMAVWRVTETCTLEKAGSWPNFDCSCCVRSLSFDASFAESFDVVVLCELGDVDEPDVVSCASRYGVIAATSTSARKMLVFFMGKLLLLRLWGTSAHIRGCC